MREFAAPDVWVQGARLYVVVVASLVALIGSAQAGRSRSFLLENQFAWLAVALMNFSAWYGCLDQFIHHAPGGVRTYITAVAVSWALVAVCFHPIKESRRRRAVRKVIRQHQKGKK